MEGSEGAKGQEAGVISTKSKMIRRGRAGTVTYEGKNGS